MSASGRKFSFPKQPAEKLSFSVEFANDLASSETISSVETAAIDLEDGSDVKATILDGVAQIQDGEQTKSKVVQMVKSGTDAKRYKITILATTSLSHIFEADINMLVDEL